MNTNQRGNSTMLGLLFGVITLLSGWGQTYRSEEAIEEGEKLAALDVYNSSLALLKDEGGALPFYVGNAVLISPQIAITSLHTFDEYGYDPTSFRVGAGKDANAMRDTQVVVDNIIPFESGNDAALLILAGAVPNGTPATLGPMKLTMDSWVTSAGLGPTTFVGGTELEWEYTRTATVNRISGFGIRGLYGSNYPEYVFNSEVHFLGSRALPGNSGGPVFALEEEDATRLDHPLLPDFQFKVSPTLVGIIIFRSGQEFTFSGRTLFLAFSEEEKEWIRAHIADDSAEQSPSGIPKPIKVQSNEIDGNKVVSVYFLRSSDAELQDLYTLETSSDLVNWRTAEVSMTVSHESVLDKDYERVRADFPIEKGFLSVRLKLSSIR